MIDFKFDSQKFIIRPIFSDNNEFIIIDNPIKQTSTINIKNGLTKNNIQKAFKVICSSKEREYQIDAKKFTSNEITEEEIIKIFIYINEEINGKHFSLKSEQKKSPQHVIVTNINPSNFYEDELIASQLSEIKFLQDMPSNILTINRMTETIEKISNLNKNLKMKILNHVDLKKLGMNLILGVNQGSKEKTKVLVLEYKGNKKSNEIVSLVGKGIIFDTGGYNLKTGKHMLNMKYDMSGAAICAITIDTIAKLNLNINVSAVIPLTDNAVNEFAQVPETILTSMSGKTVEIANTDAEGRLILADGITYAAKELNSSLIIDIATLTGTVVYALGKYTGVWSTSNKNWSLFEKSAKLANEKVWRMPLDNEYIEHLSKETFADTLSCSLSEYPDSNIAAAWLNEFALGKDYIHLDIAGSAEWNGKGRAPMLKTLIYFLKSIEK